jgi:4-hydroxy-tetrahydrodipicolinate synthase
MWPVGGLDLYFAPKRGDAARAADVQAMGRRLTDLCTSGGRTLYPATKAAMDMMGLPGGGVPRRPLRALEGAPLKGLEQGLKQLGLL